MQVLVPYFGYRDADAAIDMLVGAFGFTVAARFDADDGHVMHAELELRGARIMVGTAGPAQRTHRDESPAGHGTYVVVDDVDAHHARAVAAGAEIVYPPEDTEFGTRRYRARDTEGYEWSFGTYQPGV